MTKKRKSQRQSTRRQAKKLEIARAQGAILGASSRADRAESVAGRVLRCRA
jgi:hypothetical protein